MDKTTYFELGNIFKLMNYKNTPLEPNKKSIYGFKKHGLTVNEFEILYRE